MTSILATPSYLKYIYGMVSGKRREKLDRILEPLQAMLQLCLLGTSPIGSKLTINDNLLTIQPPGISQGIIRYFNDDTKEDVYYLFNVFRRFVMYYKFLYQHEHTRELYELLIELCKSGLDKLIETYNSSDKINVLHALTMYKVILDKPDLVIPNTEDTTPNTTTSSTTTENTHKKTHKKDHLNTSSILQNNVIPDFDNLSSTGTNKSNIDNIFIKITDIYSKEELQIIHSTLLILKHKKDTEECQPYINGLNLILQPTYTKIKKWINDNIAL